MRAPSQAPPPPALPLTQASKPRLNDPFFPAEYTRMRRPPSSYVHTQLNLLFPCLFFIIRASEYLLSILNLLTVYWNLKVVAIT